MKRRPHVSARARGATRAARALLLAFPLIVSIAACGPASPSDGPGAVVEHAIELAADKDLEGLRGLACAGQEDLIRNELGITGSLDAAQLIPGLDMQALLDAVNVDAGDLKAGEASIDGDVAEVPVSGTIKVTFDKAAMRPVLRQVLEQNGTTMTDDQIDALLDTLQAYGTDLPVDQVVRLLREDGAWKICQDTVPSPSP